MKPWRCSKNRKRIIRELNNQDALQSLLGNQAQILHIQGKSQEAMAMHKEKERICREMGNLDGIQESLGDQALILQKWGKLDESMNLLMEKEKICLQLNNARGLCLSWVYQGTNSSLKGIKQRMKLMNKAFDLAHRRLSDVGRKNKKSAGPLFMRVFPRSMKKLINWQN
jgi:hypothetical protein